MTTLRHLIATLCMMMAALTAGAQHFTGMTGLINTPSADMNRAGDVMIGGYFLNKHFTPTTTGKSGFELDGEKYNTCDFYASITPFSWVELTYTFTLFKSVDDGYTKPSYNRKDRYLSIKLNPLREGRWYPAVAIGANDFLGSPTKTHAGGSHDAGYFSNFYIVATKHFAPWSQDIAVNLAYRYCPNGHTKKWQGVVGGLTWRPKWVPDLRAIVEYTGNEVNIGADVLLWKHLFLQACMQNGKHFSGGACLKMNLF